MLCKEPGCVASVFYRNEDNCCLFDDVYETFHNPLCNKMDNFATLYLVCGLVLFLSLFCCCCLSMREVRVFLIN